MLSLPVAPHGLATVRTGEPGVPSVKDSALEGE